MGHVGDVGDAGDVGDTGDMGAVRGCLSGGREWGCCGRLCVEVVNVVSVSKHCIHTVVQDCTFDSDLDC